MYPISFLFWFFESQLMEYQKSVLQMDGYATSDGKSFSCTYNWLFSGMLVLYAL